MEIWVAILIQATIVLLGIWYLLVNRRRKQESLETLKRSVEERKGRDETEERKAES
jgi:flagellar biosynthesis/type III secretory pathway M-ring protein FliF/YscJ